MIYCGNNSSNSDILSGKLSIGTRYTCMRKGIGKGIRMRVDKNYLDKYTPIDKRRIYCGTSKRLPDDYDSLGNLPQCLQKGIGIGKKLKYEKYIKKNSGKKSNRKVASRKSTSRKVASRKVASRKSTSKRPVGRPRKSSRKNTRKVVRKKV